MSRNPVVRLTMFCSLMLQVVLTDDKKKYNVPFI